MYKLKESDLITENLVIELFNKGTNLNYSLILVGAHNANKSQWIIEKSIKRGKVLLIEPVSYLANQLRENYSSHAEQIEILEAAIDIKNGNQPFYFFNQTTDSIDFCASQMGSLNPDHAIFHNPNLASYLNKTNVKTISFESLVEIYSISQIQLLVTDMEGKDVETLLQFPFDRILPREIYSEIKHSDGIMEIGKKLASLINLLVDMGYKCKIDGAENLYARR